MNYVSSTYIYITKMFMKKRTKVNPKNMNHGFIMLTFLYGFSKYRF